MSAFSKLISRFTHLPCHSISTLQRAFYSAFINRHIGTGGAEDEGSILKVVGCSSQLDFIKKVIPGPILASKPASSPEVSATGLEEHEFLTRAKEVAAKNKVYRSFIGLGYYGNFTPTVILRNILEVGCA